MNSFKVIFYTKVGGDCPVEDFLLSLDLKMRAKILGMMNLLGEKGNALREAKDDFMERGVGNEEDENA